MAWTHHFPHVSPPPGRGSGWFVRWLDGFLIACEVAERAGEGAGGYEFVTK